MLMMSHVTQEAEAAERGTSPMTATCRAIVGAVVGLGVDQEDRKRTWMADADEALRRGSVHTARAILVHARTKFPGKKSIWRYNSDVMPLCLISTPRKITFGINVGWHLLLYADRDCHG